MWTSYLPVVAAQDALTDLEIAASILNALVNTGKPVLLYLKNNTTAHSVLAYAHAPSSSGGSFDIYDPNRPADASRVISYDAQAGFLPYCLLSSICFDKIRYNGDGSLKLAEPFQNVLDDADLSFHHSANASIDLTSHANGEQVRSGRVALAGKIESSRVLVDRLNVGVGEVLYQVPVGLTGRFDVLVELRAGTNVIRFETQGRNADGDRITVPNNLDSIKLVLLPDPQTQGFAGAAPASDRSGPSDIVMAAREFAEWWPRPLATVSPTAWADAVAVTPAGGAFEVFLPDGSAPVRLVVPAGVAVRDFELRLGLSDAAFTPKRGKRADSVLVLASDIDRFEQPIRIEVRLNQSPLQRVPVAYALGDDGRVMLLDSVWDRAQDILSIYTFHPVVFTWVLD